MVNTQRNYFCRTPCESLSGKCFIIGSKCLETESALLENGCCDDAIGL